MVKLESYHKGNYKPGRHLVWQAAWYFINLLVFKSGWFPFSGIKVLILRFFGARLGTGVVIKPCVSIKYPWNLQMGSHVWIGEGVWIDNLVMVSIGSNCCLSQGAMLLTGNHNYKSIYFDLMVGEIRLEDGVWIGAKSIVAPGVVCGQYAVLMVNSVASTRLEPSQLYRGNPAVAVGSRDFNK